jgi:glycosyltransferase involved in cell wall biosynthesis
MQNKAQPLVSILMPYYNNKAHVEASIQSVKAQSYPNLEFIVVDDASPDAEAKQLIQSLAATYGFTLITKTKNEGASKALQTGFEACSGAYVAVISHDDLYTADKIQHTMALIMEQELDALYCNGAVFEDGRLDEAVAFPSEEVLACLKTSQQCVAELISRKDTVGALLTQGAVYKRLIFKELSWMRERFLLDDWPFTIKVWRDYKVSYHDEVVYYYRKHDNNIHMQFWRWFPARIQTIGELIDDDKKLEVTAFMLADLAQFSLLNKAYDEAYRFAMAGLAMADTKETQEKALIFLRHLAHLQPQVVQQRNHLLKAKLFPFVLRDSFLRKLTRNTLKTGISLIPVKTMRSRLKAGLNL